MKTTLLVIIAVAFVASATAYALRGRYQKPTNPISTSTMSFYDLKINGIDGKPLELASFKGKYILCVNVASKCGYTPQYEDLEKLYEQYKEKLVIIGFPCNQFLGQEPGSAEEIVTFCQRNYGVTFPLTEKIDVKGRDQHPVYQWLTSKSINGVSDGNVKWNFHKFLISPNGEWMKEYGSDVKPFDESITSLLK